ncbi:MAG: photosynthetic complex assembly protein PuhC [Alphaproteobacteria bacterium]|nr:photosynthetic complex assembly protein PuhC [Alphaproteobacteria bacterium]
MGDSFFDRPFPRPALYAAGALIGFSILFAGIAAQTGLGKEEVVVESEIVRSQTLTFADREDGAVIVATADGDILKVVQGDASGFIRGVLRSLARARAAQGHGPEKPFTLTLWADGHLALDDHATGQRTYLNGFGPTNYQAFQSLIIPGEAKK